MPSVGASIIAQGDGSEHQLLAPQKQRELQRPFEAFS
jgi:hypothetical protein